MVKYKTQFMFTDRKEAAIELAKALEVYRNKNVIILGIPRGGAVIGYYVACYLDAEFSLLVSRKLGHPENPEFAVGAIAEDGTSYLSDFALKEVSRAQLDYALAVQKQEIKRRIKVLRNGEPLPPLKDRVIIIVDDGIATGATIFAAIKMCKKQHSAKIVIAAPVAAVGITDKLSKEADEVVILAAPGYIHAISQVYLSFVQVSDAEVMSIYQLWKREHSRLSTRQVEQQIVDEP